MPTKRTKSSSKTKKSSVSSRPKRLSSKAKIQDNFFKRNFVAILIFVLLFGAIGIYLIVQSHAAPTYDFIHAGSQSGPCFSGASSTSSATLAQCDQNFDNRLWVDPSTTRFQIKSKDGYCLDDWMGGVQTKTIADGGKRVYVHYRQCTDGDNNEKWYWDGFNGNNHELRNVTSGGCINVLGGSATVGASLIVYQCNGQSNEAFFLSQPPANPPGGGTGGNCPSYLTSTPAQAQAEAKCLLPQWGWNPDNQYPPLYSLWNHESNWNYWKYNLQGSGACGIPQFLPCAPKYAANSCSNFIGNTTCQIKQGFEYIKAQYGSPQGAWDHWLQYGSYVTYRDPSTGQTTSW